MNNAFLWRRMELPSVDETFCTGCGDCVLLCPVDCLAMRGRLPMLIRPTDCVSCALCVEVCPVDALEMAEVEKEER